MDFEISWLLLGLPAAFALGWIASRFDWRQQRMHNRLAPKAYFQGLNHLLNEQQDQAIDAFIEAVRSDPDTSELHFALGNLFRRRGEFDRAVRVHEHLLGRGDLSQSDRQRAQYALALDFLKAGLLDRAEDALRRLDGTSHAAQAHLALLGLYERARDWPQAQTMAERLQADGLGDFAGRIAHFLCERAQVCVAQGDIDGARALLDAAAERAPAAPRVWIELAHLLARSQGRADAFAVLSRGFVQVPVHSQPLLASGLAQFADTPEQQAAAQATLQSCYDANASYEVLTALIQIAQKPSAAHVVPDASSGGVQRAEAALLERHLRTEPSLAAAARWLELDGAGATSPRDAAAMALVHRTLARAVQPQLRYRCAACGFEAQHHLWQCPGCLTWDSYPARRVEEL